jgi:hypothetical protein
LAWRLAVAARHNDVTRRQDVRAFFARGWLVQPGSFWVSAHSRLLLLMLMLMQRRRRRPRPWMPGGAGTRRMRPHCWRWRLACPWCASDARAAKTSQSADPAAAAAAAAACGPEQVSCRHRLRRGLPVLLIEIRHPWPLLLLLLLRLRLLLLLLLLLLLAGFILLLQPLQIIPVQIIRHFVIAARVRGRRRPRTRC